MVGGEFVVVQRREWSLIKYLHIFINTTDKDRINLITGEASLVEFVCVQKEGVIYIITITVQILIMLYFLI